MAFVPRDFSTPLYWRDRKISQLEALRAVFPRGDADIQTLDNAITRIKLQYSSYPATTVAPNYKEWAWWYSWDEVWSKLSGFIELISTITELTTALEHFTTSAQFENPAAVDRFPRHCVALLTIKYCELLKRSRVRQHFTPLSRQEEMRFIDIRNQCAHEYESPYYRPAEHYQCLMDHPVSLELGDVRGKLRYFIEAAECSVEHEITWWDQRYGLEAREEESSRRRVFRDNQSGKRCDICDQRPESEPFKSCDHIIGLTWDNDIDLPPPVKVVEKEAPEEEAPEEEAPEEEAPEEEAPEEEAPQEEAPEEEAPQEEAPESGSKAHARRTLSQIRGKFPRSGRGSEYGRS